MRSILKVTAVQDELILNYQAYDLTSEEFICICQLLTLDPLYIDLIEFLKVTQNNKPLISSLAAKNLISLGERQGKMTIDLSNLYGVLENPSEKLESVGLSNNQIDKLIHIFGRNLNPHEISKINSWMSAGATFEKIEEAIYIALGREISNLNYIEKIIQNSDSQVAPIEQKTSPVKRNWTY